MMKLDYQRLPFATFRVRVTDPAHAHVAHLGEGDFLRAVRHA